jgi:hypothetical protein
MWTPGNIYYVKEGGDDSTGDGLAMSTAWKTITKALSVAGKTNSSAVLIAPDVVDDMAANLTSMSGTGTQDKPFLIMGWPLPAKTGLTGDFTNGSDEVSDVTGVSLDNDDDQGRLITGPDGKIYQIGRVDSASTFRLNVKYQGTTAADGAFQINEDDLYDWAQALVAGDGAYDIATWNAMTATRPNLVMSTYNLTFNQPNWFVKNLKISDIRGSFRFQATGFTNIDSCIFKNRS